MLTTIQLYLRYQESTRFWISDQRLKLLRNLSFLTALKITLLPLNREYKKNIKLFNYRRF